MRTGPPVHPQRLRWKAATIIMNHHHIFRRLRTWLAVLPLSAALAATLSAPALAEGNWELRVCADAQGLPFSDRDTPGFENRIAGLIADELGADLTYDWTRFNDDLFNRHFGEGTCDVIMGVPDGTSRTLTTITYYQSPYVMVYRADAPFGHISDMDDPTLADLTIGVQGQGTPPHEALRQRGLTAQVARIYGGEEGEDRLGRMVGAVASGELDVGFGWGAAVGYWAERAPVELVVQPVEPAFDLPALFQFQPMTMAVRSNDIAMQERLNRAIAARWDDIQQVLADYRVPVMPAVAPGAPSLTAPRDTLRIGVVLPMPTGTRTKTARVYDLAGELARQGALFAEAGSGRDRSGGGSGLKLLLANSPSAEAARRAAEALLSLGEADALIGGLGAGQAAELAEVAAAYGVPFLNVGSVDVDLRERCLPGVFHVQPSVASYVSAMVDLYGTDAAEDSWFIVHEDGPEGEAYLREAERVLAARGVTLAGSRAVETNRPVYFDVLDEARDAGAGTVALFLDAPDELALIGQAEDAGYGLRFAPFPDPLNQTRQFLGAANSYGVGGDIPRIQLWEPTLATPGAAGLNEEFAGQWGQPFDAPAWATFEAVTVLVAAAREAGSSAPADLLAALPAVDAGVAGGKAAGQHFSADGHELSQELYAVGTNADNRWGMRLSRRLDAGTLLEVLPAPVPGGSCGQ